MSYVLPNIANFWNPASNHSAPWVYQILIMSWKYNNPKQRGPTAGEKRPIVEKSVHGCVGCSAENGLQTQSSPFRFFVFSHAGGNRRVLNLNRADDPILAGSTPVTPAKRRAKARSSNAASPKEPGGVAPEPGRSNEAVGEAILRDYADPTKLRNTIWPLSPNS